jgi:serine/threonine protein kinase
MTASVNSSAAVAPADSASGLDDPRVVRAAQEYLAQAETGGKPSLSEFVARYPDIAEPLGRCLAGLEFVQAAAPHLSQPLDGVAPADGGGAVTGTLGDFRLIREVGRGGMGVVYEAEQISLGRRVALKVLPFAATMDPRHLQRFYNEARAAAGLHHEHIVPVHAVGCERGVHYYAMQFVDGRTLADVIAGLRDGPAPANREQPTAAHGPPPGADPPAADTAPVAAQATSAAPRQAASYRRVAEWGVQAAGALEHAHALGVVHRDVKPANLMIDGRGKLWVTDFGLARFGADTGLTMTGDLVGTLRYMSPEQALARHGLVDHRTDVYALGATLYELLTLRPAFDGKDRAEVLRQIAFDEPRPPRQVERAIPADLETVVLKALVKEPAERYATAQELADDLRRWLGDQPIRARRPSLRLRATKWARRHRPLVLSAGVLLLLALVLLAVSNVVIWVEHERTKTALWEAKLHQKEVDYLAPQLFALRNKSEPKLQRSLKAMDRILAEVEEAPPGPVPELAQAREAVSGQALEFYNELLPLESNRPSLQWEEMWAYVRLGSLHALRDQFAEAQQACEKASAIAAEQFGRRPAPSTSNGNRKVYTILFADEFQDRPAAERTFRKALAHWRAAAPQGLGAVADYRAALACPLEDSTPSPSALNPGDPVPERDDFYGQRIGLLERVLADLPTPRHRCTLVRLLIGYGGDLGAAGRHQDAMAAYRRARDCGEGWRDDVPTDQNYLPLAWDLKELGRIMQDQGQIADAERCFRACLDLIGRQAGGNAAGGMTLFVSINSRSDFARFLFAKGDLDGAVAEYRACLRLDEKAALAHCGLGEALKQQGHFTDALVHYRRGHELGSKIEGWRNPSEQWVQECERLAELDAKLPLVLAGKAEPGGATERLDLAFICATPARQLDATAASFYAAALAAEPRLNGDQPSAPRYNAACAAALAGCGRGHDAATLGQAERSRLRQQALDWLRAELQVWRRLLERGPDKDRRAIAPELNHWLADPDFCGVRGPEALAKLPEPECHDWQRLWEEIADTLAQAERSGTPVPPTSIIFVPPESGR